MTDGPRWHRTGYRFFPFAAEQSGRWWVLRINHGFPEHDLYTLFVDGEAVGDLTSTPDDASRLPVLDAATARSVVAPVSGFVDYGSEAGDPCIFCSGDDDGMTLS